jgi:23S rRNA pseudouridine955/2504/2580 synthase
MVKVDHKHVAKDEDGQRLDRWLKLHYPELPHGRLHKLCRTGQVRVDGCRVKANARLAAGQEVRAPLFEGEMEGRTAASGAGAVPPGVKPSLTPRMGLSKADRTFIENMIIYEDDHVLILNKPYGIAVQGGSGMTRHIDGLLAGMEDRFGCRVRLVHRLDRDTTGVLLAAKSRDAAAKLGRLFQTRTVQKVYWALARGIPKPAQGKVEASLVKTTGPDGDRVRKAGPGEQETAQHAVTHYSVIDQASTKVSWISLKPVTGRQHQLRVHMAILGTPIIGDTKYDSREELPLDGIERKLHLHARRLALPHPDGESVIDITAPLPEHMYATWELLGFDPERYSDAGERAHN